VPRLAHRAVVATCVAAGIAGASGLAAGGSTRPAPTQPTAGAASPASAGIAGISTSLGRGSVVMRSSATGASALTRSATTRAGRAFTRDPLTLAGQSPGPASPRAAARVPAAAVRPAARAAIRSAPVAPTWTRPNRGPLSSPFGTRWGRPHEGIDLAGGYGSPILAAADGVVLYAGPEIGYGRVVKIRHADGTQTWYGHMSKCLVNTGDRVKVGQEIALVGSAGDATGPHLHFEVRVGGVPVDPVPFLAQRGVHI
jgi:murein DD-endopeptidase MepM/ murein hydrolase activator NlpD